jgi:hypothetical protein
VLLRLYTYLSRHSYSDLWACEYLAGWVGVGGGGY